MEKMKDLAAARGMTLDEKRLARHTLGLDNPDAKGISYRNRYYAGREHPSWHTLHDMVAMGWMNLEDVLPNMKQTIFWLNRTGAELALEPGEKLDREDFPPPQAATS